VAGDSDGATSCGSGSAGELAATRPAMGQIGLLSFSTLIGKFQGGYSGVTSKQASGIFHL
jgi:hypothetical protein